MNDQQADVALTAVMELAITLRDEGPTDVRKAAGRVLAACGRDPIAAVCVAAALVPVDRPVDAWWARGLDGVGAPENLPQCGTHAAFNRHRARGEKPDIDCVEAERIFQRVARRHQRAAA